MKSAASAGDGSRRVWSDPLFFALMAAIGATYVVLIVAMLAADAFYLLTGTPDIPVTIDFETDASGKVLAGSTPLTAAYQAYGLSITLIDGDGELRVIDSGRVPWSLRRWGTPHVDFGGPGVGAGGSRGQPTRNERPLGKILVVGEKSLAAPRHECRFDFPGETVLRRIVFPQPIGRPVDVTAVDAQGEEKSFRISAGTSRWQWPGGPARRVIVGAPWDFGRVEIEYENRGTARADTGKGGDTDASSLRVMVADPEAGRVRPAGGPAVVRLEWIDPVALDQVVLLNALDAAGLTLHDASGAVIRRHRVPAGGADGVRRVVLEQREVAALTVSLPREAALAEIRFRWRGRVPSEWERRHPRLARWTHNPLVTALQKREIQYSIKLTLLACTLTTILSLWVAVPVGYLLSRYRFPFHNLIDAILDIPIVLPPLVVGLSLLILFQFFPAAVQSRIVYEIPAVILAQFAVSCAFAVRSMRGSFMQIDRRREQVALTLGCTRAQAFFYVVLPEAGRGMLTAGTLAWARALGEFGPLLVFAGATRMKTEVLSTTVFLELSVGDLGAAVAVSLIMVASAIVVLVLARMWGSRVLSL